jgi:hypothetical protein
MAFIAGSLRGSKCRHGAEPQRCYTQGCTHWNQIPYDHPARFFGKDSSSQAASELMKQSPEQYHAMKEKARLLGLIAF